MRLSIRLNQDLSDKCQTLSDTLRITRSQVIKQALADYYDIVTAHLNPNVRQTSDTPARAHGMNTSYKYIRTIPPPPNASAPREEEEEEGNTNTNHYPGFKRFWEIYHLFKGFKPGHADCLKAWRDMDLETITDEIIDAVKRFKRSESWRSGYAPMAINFIKAMKWRDAPPEEEDFVINA